MDKVFVHMDEGWPGAVRTKRGGNGEAIWHIRADYESDHTAAYAYGLCGVEARLVAFEVRPDVRSIMYMFSRLRSIDGHDIEGFPVCMWLSRDHKGVGGWYIRVGLHTIKAPVFNSAIERQEFLERIDDELDKVFPPELYSLPHSNWRDIECAH